MANEASRARAGATYMDMTCVGWPWKIDADRLDLSCCFDCVFGQAFDDHYLNVQLKLGLSTIECAALGFCSEAKTGYSLEAWVALAPEARAEIREQVSLEYLALRSAWLSEIALRLETPSAEEARVEALPVATWEDPL